MPNGLEIAKAAIDDFAELKEEYISLKAILNVAGVNLAELDKIKE